VTTAHDLLERLFASEAAFDPAGAQREFTLLASDYASSVFGAALARGAREEAPGVTLRFQQPPRDITEDTKNVLSSVDGLLLPHGSISDFPATDLYRDRWAYIADADHPGLDDGLTLDHLARLPWVAYQRTYDAPAVRQLGMLGIEPRVEVFVDSFQALPFHVAGTDRIALIQQTLADRLAQVAGVRILDCPYEAVPLHEALWWHPVHTRDPAHEWLRETAVRVGREVRPGSGS
jgi:DNA-binding transcriptional LysR family regulator